MTEKPDVVARGAVHDVVYSLMLELLYRAEIFYDPYVRYLCC